MKEEVRTMWKRILMTIALSFGALALLPACEQEEGPAEEAAEEIEDTTDEMEDVADEVEGEY
jgi:uncharacterized protein Yka (UPF0111/DUF47 family)